MQPVQKREKRKKEGWLVFGLLALLASALALVFVLMNRPPLIPEPSNHLEESLTLIQKDATDLVRIEISPSFGEGFVLVREGDQFVVEGSPSFPLETREIDLMVKDLTLLVVNEVMGQIDPDDTESLEAIGLGSDAARVWAVYADGVRKGFFFGGSAATETPADYFMLEEDDRVFTVSPEMRSHFDRTLNTLHPVSAINFTSDLLDEAEFRGDRAFTLSLRGGLWELTSPKRYPADEAAVSAFLSSVDQMRLAVFASIASEENLSLYGFGPESRSVTFHLAPSAITAYDDEGTPVGKREVEAQTLSLSIGNDIDRIGFYCLYDGGIWQVSVASMGFLREAAWESLRSRAPVNVPLNRLDTLRVEKGGSETTYSVSLVESVLPNNELETDDAGNPLFLPDIQRNSTDMDRDEFLREYLKLMALTASGILPEGYESKDDPAARYLLTGPGIQLELVLYPFDALHYAMRVNGHFTDYVDRRQADAVAI